MPKKTLQSANPALRARLTYLYNAAEYLTAIQIAQNQNYSSSRSSYLDHAKQSQQQPDEISDEEKHNPSSSSQLPPSHLQANTSHSPDDSGSDSDKFKSKPNFVFGLPRHLSTHMTTLSRKTQTRLPRDMKRKVCKRCAGLLISDAVAAAEEGESKKFSIGTAKTYIENPSGKTKTSIGQQKRSRSSSSSSSRNSRNTKPVNTNTFETEIGAEPEINPEEPNPGLDPGLEARIPKQTQLQNSLKGEKKPWADIQITQCRFCAAEKRIPTGINRLKRSANGRSSSKAHDNGDSHNNGTPNNDAKDNSNSSASNSVSNCDAKATTNDLISNENINLVSNVNSKPNTNSNPLKYIIEVNSENPIKHQNKNKTEEKIIHADIDSAGTALTLGQKLQRVDQIQRERRIARKAQKRERRRAKKKPKNREEK